MRDTTKWHKLTDVDRTAKTGTCSLCGPVQVYLKSKGTRYPPEQKQIICINKIRESKRKGDPRPTETQRFLAKFVISAEDDCWLWSGKKTTGKKPYGALQINKKTVLAHRYSYVYFTGNLLHSYDSVHHKCSTQLCVNPKHLQVASRADNTLEMLERRYYTERIAELEAQLEECVCTS